LSRPVYSFALIQYGGSPPTGGVFYVPAGYTAVIRDIDGIGKATGFDYFQLNLNGEPGTVPVIYQPLTTGLQTIQWRGRLVVPQTWTIEIDPDALPGLDSVWISGYVLTNDG